MQSVQIQLISQIKVAYFLNEVYEYVHIDPKIEHFF